MHQHQYLWEHILLPVAIIAGSFCVFLGVRLLLMHWLPRLGREGVGATVIRCVRYPSYIWCATAALALGLGFAPLSDKVEARLNSLVQIAFVFSLTWAIANLTVGLTRDFLRKIDSPMAESSIIYGFTRSVIFSVGILVIFSELNIAITPILTAFGVAGLSVALAFKDTLENLFSGLHLLVDKAVVVGDDIRLENGQEGDLLDIGWRTTKMRLPGGDLLIIPNIKFAQSILVKRSEPQTARSGS